MFKDRICHICHTFGNVDFGTSQAQLMATEATTALAPNLRFTAERTRPEVLVDWILAPQKIKPGTTMPPMVSDRGEAEAIAAFLRTAIRC